VSLPLTLPSAHALVARQDLPIPAWLFAWAASIVLIVSFFALSAAWRRPIFEDQRWRAVGAGALARALTGRVAQALCGAIGAFLLAVAIYAGLRGTEAPDRNFALTFLFVTCWLGFPFLSAIFGDFFRPFNPGGRSGAPPGPRSPRRGRPGRGSSPTRRGSAAGPRRSGCSRWSGSRSSTGRAAAWRWASTHIPAPSPPASTAPTRWR
jgi:hypothetical protein